MKIQDIKKGAYLKYLATTFLVKDCILNEDKETYTIKYFFSLTNRGGIKKGKLYCDGTIREESCKIKMCSSEDIERLKTKIQYEYPSFDFGTLSYKESNTITNNDELTEEKCIDFLKEKGYLIFKQI